MVAAETARDLAAALPAGSASPVTIDRALMRVSRALIPMDYTTGDRFAHDPALPVPAWASLSAIRALAATPAGSDRARLLTVDATRARNRVLHALRRANGILSRAAGAPSDRLSENRTA